MKIDSMEPSGTRLVDHAFRPPVVEPLWSMALKAPVPKTKPRLT
jgi:hypothetical protein